MLLLVTIVLVLIAAVTLLIGIFSDNLPLIFVSIGSSALAALVLAVVSQVNKRKGKAPATTAPEPLPERQPTPAPAPDPEPTVATVATEPATAAMPAVGSGELPIENYDSLRVSEILPRLADLDLDELEAVAQHEETHKNRTTVLNRIDQRMDELEAAEDAPVAGGTGGASDEIVEEAIAAIAEVGEPVVASDENSPIGAAAMAELDAVTGDEFPIPDYDDLDEDELIPLLDDLDADQLEAVADREEAGRNRDAVLDAIDDRLDILEGIVPAPAPVKAAPAKRSPAKKAPAAKKAAAAKKAPAGTARKAPAPVATGRAVKAAKAAPAARAVKAPAKKAAAAAKKAPAATGRAAAAAAKAVPAKKTAAKKAVAAKKAPAARKAASR